MSIELSHWCWLTCITGANFAHCIIWAIYMNVCMCHRYQIYNKLDLLPSYWWSLSLNIIKHAARPLDESHQISSMPLWCILGMEMVIPFPESHEQEVGLNKTATANQIYYLVIRLISLVFLIPCLQPPNQSYYVSPHLPKTVYRKHRASDILHLYSGCMLSSLAYWIKAVNI